MSKTLSRYAILFGEASSHWYPWDTRTNLEFIGAVEDRCNRRLKEEGCLYLNEVYEMLDVPKTKAGECVGWVKDSKYGDGFVALDIIGILNYKNFVVDFNVDGMIKY